MTTNIHTTQTYPHSAATIWPILSDFFTPWHPFIDWCEQVDDRTRRFGMPGEETIYIEQLTEIDHDRHHFSYIMHQGIEGIDSYRGTAYIEEISADICCVVWEADIVGPDKITTRVGAGTEAVFNAGLDEIANILDRRAIKTVVLEGYPPLAVDVAGSGDLVLFLHGIGGNRTNWHPQLNALADRFTCAALDFRGYGLSDLGDEEITAHVPINDVLRVLDHIEVEKVHLVGLSYGSWIAASVAHCHPTRIQSLTLCSGSTGMTLASADERTQFKQLRLDPIEAGQTPADIAPAVVEAISGPNATDDQKQILLESMQTIPRETYIAALKCFLNPPFRIEFEQFNFPTLFVAGEHDRLASPEEMQGVARRVQGSQFEVIEGAGHLSNLEAEEEFNRLLAEFFGSSSSSVT